MRFSTPPVTWHPAIWHLLLAGAVGFIPAAGFSENLAQGAPATSPCVHFDAAPLVACRVVELSDWPDRGADSENRDDLRLIDAAFDVSTLIRFGHEAQVAQLLFVIESPARSLQVADFAPRTELTTSYVGQIERTRQAEKTGGGGLSATFAPSQFLTAQGNATQSAKTSDSVRFQSLPPMELLAASGTAARGTAVYFKFRASSQTTLEGSRELRVMFSVPRHWRGDYVYLRCAAFDQEGAQSQGRPICGSSDFLVPLYLVGDEQAKAAAAQLATTETALRERARSYAKYPARGQDESLGDKLVSMFHPPRPRVPASWLNTVLTSSPAQCEFAFRDRLPEELDEAVERFTQARRELAELNR